MIVSHEHRFIFVKTRKTAGTSIEIALSRVCGPRDIITPFVVSPDDEAQRREVGGRGPQHTNVPFRRYRAADWRHLVRRGRRQVFRNHMPAELIRHYVGQRVWDDYFTFAFDRDPFDKAISQYWWQMRDLDEPQPIGDYLQSIPRRLLSNWGVYALDGRVGVDFLGRYERLADDLQAVSERIGVPIELPPSRAKGGVRKDHRHYSTLIDEQARARIEDVCRNEIAALGYQWQEA